MPFFLLFLSHIIKIFTSQWINSILWCFWYYWYYWGRCYHICILNIITFDWHLSSTLWQFDLEKVISKHQSIWVDLLFNNSFLIIFSCNFFNFTRISIQSPIEKWFSVLLLCVTKDLNFTCFKVEVYIEILKIIFVLRWGILPEFRCTAVRQTVHYWFKHLLHWKSPILIPLCLFGSFQFLELLLKLVILLHNFLDLLIDLSFNFSSELFVEYFLGQPVSHVVFDLVEINLTHNIINMLLLKWRKLHIWGSFSWRDTSLRS